MVADDPWWDLGCHGGEIPTPAIDAPAGRALRLRDFYTGGGCDRTRASLHYGVYCHRLRHTGRLWDATLETSPAAIEHPAARGARGLDPLDGASLVDLLGEGADPGERGLAFALCGPGLVSDRWKLASRDRESALERHDPEAIGGETRDRAAVEPGRVEALTRTLAAWRERVDGR